MYEKNIYDVKYDGEKEIVYYHVRNNNYCLNINRKHKSNHIYFQVQRQDCKLRRYVIIITKILIFFLVNCFHQKCFDPDCNDPISFKSQSFELPVDDVWRQNTIESS